MFWNARAMPSLAIWCGPHRRQQRVAVADLARGGLVDAGQDVEHRRLARAVGADDGVHGAGLDPEARRRRAPGRRRSGRSRRPPRWPDLRADPSGWRSDRAPRGAGGLLGGGHGCHRERVRPAVRAGRRRAAAVAGRRVRRRDRGRAAGRRRSARARPRDPSATPGRRRARTRCRPPPAPSSAFCSTSSTAVPCAVDLADHLADLADHLRRQPERGLVEQQQLRAGHQPAADREHLLLAAGQQPGALVAPVGQDGEQVVDPLRRPWPWRPGRASPARRPAGSPRRSAG